MAQLFTIKKVVVGPRKLDAEVELAASAPVMTSDDAEGTARVLELVPELADHVCLGDASEHFGEVAEKTELAHLLEHVAVELLARTDAAGDVATGQTVELGERTWRVSLGCVDDVLVAGALSSAAWIMQWAYSGGGEPEPDVDAIAKGLVDLVASLGEKPEDEGPVAADEDAPDAPSDAPDVPSDAPSDVILSEAKDLSPVVEEEVAAPDALEPEPAPEEPEPDALEPAPAETPWDMPDVPAPHSIR